MKKTKIILIEPEKYLRELMLFSLESTFDFEVLEAETNLVGRKIFNSNRDIQLVISSNSSSDDPFINLFHDVVDHLEKVPFIVTDLENIETVAPYKERWIAGAVKKVDVIGPLNLIIKNWFQIDQEEGKNEYTRISFKTLQRFRSLDDDVYIKLPSGRYLKLFSNKDMVSEADVLRFKEKGIEKLYLKKEAAKWILIRIDDEMINIIRELKEGMARAQAEASEEASEIEELDDLGETDEIDLADVEDEQDEIVMESEGSIDNVEEEKPKTNDLIDLNVNPFVPKEDFVAAVHTQTKKAIDTIRRNKSFIDFLKKLEMGGEETDYFRRRAQLCSIIACSISKALNWGSDAAFQKLIYCSYLHDFAIIEHPKLHKLQTLKEFTEVKNTLTSEESISFINHPITVSKIVEKDPRAPKEAAAILLQHHELPKQAGFPNRLQAHRILPFAGILSISIDFSQYIIEHREWSLEEYISIGNKKYIGGIYSKIIRTLATLAVQRRKNFKRATNEKVASKMAS